MNLWGKIALISLLTILLFNGVSAEWGLAENGSFETGTVSGWRIGYVPSGYETVAYHGTEMVWQPLGTDANGYLSFLTGADANGWQGDYYIQTVPQDLGAGTNYIILYNESLGYWEEDNNNLRATIYARLLYAGQVITPSMANSIEGDAYFKSCGFNYYPTNQAAQIDLNWLPVGLYDNCEGAEWMIDLHYPVLVIRSEYISTDEVQLDHLEVDVNLAILSLTQNPSPVSLGDRVKISSTTSGSLVKLQCGESETSFNLCDSNAFGGSPSCEFVNTFTADLNVYCRIFDKQYNYSDVNSMFFDVLVGATQEEETPAGINKILFYIFISSDNILQFNEEADAVLFEDRNGNIGYITIKKSSGEMFNIPTCNLKSDCDLDLNTGLYTAIFYDALFNIEFQKTFEITDKNAIQEIAIPLDAKWFQVKFSNEDGILMKPSEIRAGSGGMLGQFKIENKFGTNYRYKKYIFKADLDTVNRYPDVDKHQDYAYVLPYAQKWGGIRGNGIYANPISWDLTYAYYVGFTWAETVWPEQTVIPDVDFPLYFGQLNKVSIIPELFKITAKITDLRTPEPYIQNRLRNKDFYERGDDVICRGIIITPGKVITAKFKIIGDDFSDINSYVGYTSTLSEIQHTFSNFSHPTEENLRCAFQVENSIGFKSAWVFSQPFTMYADLNGDVNIVVRKTDGTIADPEADIKSENAVFGKVTIIGEGLNRDFNAFSDTNHSLPTGFYTLGYQDVLDNDEIKKFSFEIPEPSYSLLIEIVVGQSNVSPVINNLKCYQEKSIWQHFLDIYIEADIYDVDGDLNKIQIKMYDIEHSAENPSFSLDRWNDGNVGAIYEQYLDAILGQTAKTCTKNNPCHLKYNTNLITEFYEGLISDTGQDRPLICDLNAVDEESNFTNKTATAYVDFPDIKIDTNRSFCSFTTPADMVFGSTYKYTLSRAGNIPLSCMIIVTWQEDPIIDFRIYFQGDATDLNYVYSWTAAGTESHNYYTGIVDVSNWGIGLFTNLTTKIEHNTYGSADLWTSALIIESIAIETKGQEAIGRWSKTEFASALKGMGTGFGTFVIYMFINFFTNPIAFFIIVFFPFVIIAFLWLTFFGRAGSKRDQS